MTRIIHVCDMTPWCIYCVTWLIHMCNVTHSYVRLLTHSCVWHYPFMQANVPLLALNSFSLYLPRHLFITKKPYILCQKHLHLLQKRSTSCAKELYISRKSVSYRPQKSPISIAKEPSTQGWRNCTLIGYEPLIRSKMCFTKTELVEW